MLWGSLGDRSGVAGRQSLARDHLAHCDLASERQQRANDIVREMHAVTVSRVERRNSALSALISLWVIGFGCIIPLHYSPRRESRHGCKGRAPEPLPTLKIQVILSPKTGFQL